MNNPNEPFRFISRRRYTYIILLAMAIACLGVREVVRTLRPVCPGIHYPADAEALRAAVRQYLQEVEVEPRPGRLSALIVPCSLYSLSGRIAASGYKLISPESYKRVIVLTPSHYATFRGCSIAAVQYHRTPLGEVAVDGPAVGKVTFSSLFDLRSINYHLGMNPLYKRPQIHELEYGVEVQLPFLQTCLKEFKLVPIVVGQLTNDKGEPDLNTIQLAAQSISSVLDKQTLLVVSTNLTLYGTDYNYVPFQEDIVRQLGKLDMKLIGRILDRDPGPFLEYVRDTGNRFVGIYPIAIMLAALPPTVRGTVLAYDTTARLNNDPRASVSFASLAFFDTDLRPKSDTADGTVLETPENKPPGT